ncbi:MAG: hypothetical protein AAF533_13465 [Acidobacteriota bacterium]
MTRPTQLTLPCVLALLLTTTGHAQDQESPSPGTPDLSGQWTLNQELSDDPREMMRRQRGQGADGRDGRSGRTERRRGGGDGFSGRGGQGGRGGRGGEARSRGGQRRGGSEGRRSGGSSVLRDTSLEISQEGSAVAVTTPRGLRLLDPATGFVTVAGGDAAPEGTNVAWEGNELVVRTPRGERGEVVERWSVSADGKQLTLAVTLPRRSGEPLTLRRVFDARPEPAPAADTSENPPKE